MNPETFLQYITRKSGMGRTGWFMAILIHAIAVLYVFYTVANYPERGWWVPLAFAVGIAAIVWGGTYGNYRLDRTRNSKPPNQNHYDDVCEGCDPVMYKNRKPITDIVHWYAAVCDLDREVARKELAAMSTEGYMAIKARHAAYLAKFPRP